MVVIANADSRKTFKKGNAIRRLMSLGMTEKRAKTFWGKDAPEMKKRGRKQFLDDKRMTATVTKLVKETSKPGKCRHITAKVVWNRSRHAKTKCKFSTVQKWMSKNTPNVRQTENKCKKASPRARKEWLDQYRGKPLAFWQQCCFVDNWHLVKLSTKGGYENESERRISRQPRPLDKRTGKPIPAAGKPEYQRRTRDKAFSGTQFSLVQALVGSQASTRQKEGALFHFEKGPRWDHVGSTLGARWGYTGL